MRVNCFSRYSFWERFFQEDFLFDLCFSPIRSGKFMIYL